MSSSFLHAASLLLLFLTSPVKAICSEENTAVCEPFSGSCSQPLLEAQGPDPLEAFRKLQYGKYCGQQTCRPVPSEITDAENECVVGSPNCPNIPCDTIDTACQAHDYCLEEDLKDLGLGPDVLRGVPIPRRCLCESQFVFSLSQVEANGLLCDEFYYAFPFPDPKDANLFAAVPCCVLLMENNDGERYCASDAVANNYSDIYDPAVATCTSLLEAVSAILGGFDVCSVATSIYTIDTGATEKCVRRNRIV